MDYKKLIEVVRKNYEDKKASFDKNDIKYLTGRDTFRGRIYGFLKFDYYRRPKLFKEGFITYALTIRVWQDSFDDNKPISTWVLFSPQSEFDENPDLLKNVKEKLDEFVQAGEKKCKYKKLYIALTGEYSEPLYMEIPKEFTDGKIVYLSYAELRQGRIPTFHIGLNLIMMNRKISKEVAYLPISYCSKEYVEFYSNKL